MNSFTEAELQAAFRSWMADAGLTTPDPIIADGRLHQIRIDSDCSNEWNAWYLLLADEAMVALLVCRSTGATRIWRPADAASTAMPVWFDPGSPLDTDEHTEAA